MNTRIYEDRVSLISNRKAPCVRAANYLRRFSLLAGVRAEGKQTELFLMIPASMNRETAEKRLNEAYWKFNA